MREVQRYWFIYQDVNEENPMNRLILANIPSALTCLNNLEEPS
jgi:hypothetical protein